MNQEYRGKEKALVAGQKTTFQANELPQRQGGMVVSPHYP